MSTIVHEFSILFGIDMHVYPSFHQCCIVTMYCYFDLISLAAHYVAVQYNKQCNPWTQNKFLEENKSLYQKNPKIATNI